MLSGGFNRRGCPVYGAGGRTGRRRTLDNTVGRDQTSDLLPTQTYRCGGNDPPVV